MKLILLSAALLLGNLMAQSQDWMPFVENQKSYYGVRTTDSTYDVSMIVWDSTLVEPTYSWAAFNSELFWSDCAYEINYNLGNERFKGLIESRYHLVTSMGGMPGERIMLSCGVGSGVEGVGRWDTSNVAFYPFSEVGDSWETNEMTISCVDKTDTVLFGVSDSIKVFRVSGSIFTGEEFILSKKHGFIEYLSPWDMMLKTDTTTFELLGYELGGIEKGFKHPKLRDMFPLNEGDVLLWRYSGYGIGSDYVRIRKDSVTYVYVSTDSIYYEFQYTNFSENGDFVSEGNSDNILLKSDYENLVRGYSGVHSLTKGERPVYYRPFEVTMTTDTVVVFGFHEESFLQIGTDCSVYEAMEGVLYRTVYSSFFGLTNNWSNSLRGGSSKALIGSIIGGAKDGENMVLGLSKMEHHDFNIYPNPFTEIISIETDQKLSKVDLVNLQGELILESNDVSQINTSNLVSGIYFVRFYNEQGLIGTEKVVK